MDRRPDTEALVRHSARWLLTLVIAVVMAGGSSLALAAPSQAATWVVSAADAGVDPLEQLDEFETRILIQINTARVNAGLNPVRHFDSCIDGRSEKWADRIRRTGNLVHRNQMKVMYGCDLAWTGETLVRGVGLTPEAAVTAWLNSPGHYAVIMTKRASLAGIGVRIDSQGRVIGVLNFGDAT